MIPKSQQKPEEFALDYPNGDLLLDIQTVNWSFVYFTDLKTYRVNYSAKLKLIDITTRKIVAEGFCSRVPEKNDNTPTRDQLLANTAERLKQELQIAAEECIDQFKEQIAPT